MMRFTTLLAGVLFFVGGCVASKTVVLVNKDGSGVVEQTAFWAEMEMGGDAPPKKFDIKEVEAAAKLTAGKLGEGVTLKSVEAKKHADGRDGARIVYAFTDVNKLKISMIPDVGPMKSDKDEDELFKMSYDKAAGKLTIVPPPPKPDANAKDKQPTPEEEAMMTAMMAKMFKGAVIEFHVQVEGSIAKTNATLVNDQKNTITLLKADMDALSKDAAAMKELMATQKIKDAKGMQKALQGPALSKYIQMDPAEKIEVEFK